MIWLYNLDTHEWFGPFRSVSWAHAFASGREIINYQLTTNGPDTPEPRTAAGSLD